MFLLMLACNADDTDPKPTGPEPIERPDDPAAAAVPVGVRTEQVGDLTVEIWYPAAEVHRGEAGDPVDFTQWVPESVTDVLGALTLPTIPADGVRDAALRDAGEPYPVVLFSHGFGGTRAQSVTLTTHWASRGFVVLATDHAGRSMPDLLPCLFSPPLEGCSLGLFDDPAVADLAVMRDWLDDPADWLDGALDPARVSVAGHSAGGGSTVTVGNDAAPAFTALLPMAGGDAVSVDTPTLRLAGTCDGIVPSSGSQVAHEASSDADVYVELVGAGHLAFSDLCTLDLGAVAEDVLLGRDDLNSLLVDSLVSLGTDGCAGYAPTVPDCGEPASPEQADEALRGVTAAFLEGADAGTLPTDPTGGYPGLRSL